jgi:hypothetical protein
MWQVAEQINTNTWPLRVIKEGRIRGTANDAMLAAEQYIAALAAARLHESSEYSI